MMKYNASFWFLATFSIMLLLEFIYPLGYKFSLQAPFGVLLLLISLLISLWCKYVYTRHHTSYHPNEKASYLITEGVYSLSRNPIYIALLIAFMGFSLILYLSYAIFGGLLFFIILSQLVIPYEEQTLYDIFGKTYLEYKSFSPKWL